MKTEHIEIFCVLAETLNYTNAANRLYMTQSAMTRAIQQMENELGFQLFDRSRRSVSLTPAGTSFYEGSKKLLDLYRTVVNEARDAHDGFTGKIRIATHLFRVNSIELEIFHDFQQEYPYIVLDILSKHSSEMVYLLNEGYIDCAIGTARTADKNIRRHILLKTRDCLVVAPDHPLADREVISFEELRNERFAVISQKYAAKGYDMVKARAFEAGFDPHIEENASSVAHLMAIISTGRYVTLLSENYQEMIPGNMKFIPLAGEPISELSFFWKENPDNPCIELLADFVSDCFALHE